MYLVVLFNMLMQAIRKKIPFKHIIIDFLKSIIVHSNGCHAIVYVMEYVEKSEKYI